MDFLVSKVWVDSVLYNGPQGLLPVLFVYCTDAFRGNYSGYVV